MMNSHKKKNLIWMLGGVVVGVVFGAKIKEMLKLG
jgi:hypothetical protein